MNLKRDYLLHFFSADPEDAIFVIYHINNDDFICRYKGEDDIYFDKRSVISRLSSIGLNNIAVYPTDDDMDPDFRFPIMGNCLEEGIKKLVDAVSGVSTPMTNVFRNASGITKDISDWNVPEETIHGK